VLFIDALLIASYGLVATLLAIFASHRVLLALRHQRAVRIPRNPATWEGPLPRVVVQVPIYNEAAVVERTIRAACELDWPHERLEIQILDDSDDDTREHAAELIARARKDGVPISHVTRAIRTGYKAGALANGLTQSRGEFIAVFDADFVPPRDFLRRAVPHFSDDSIGMVQARWDHLNREHSLLTRLQALLLDGHFEIEHLTRNREGLFFNFNGTAGVWRRACIEEAGGWDHDTLTEDLDLSYRAQLAGWKFSYLNDLLVPAELPIQVRAFKSQQHRWTKGAVQTGKKLLPRIWTSPIPLSNKIEASFHLLDHYAPVVVLLFSALLAPLLLARSDHLPEALSRFIGYGFLLMSLLALGIFYGVTAWSHRGRLMENLLLIPLIIPLIAGLGVTSFRAVIEGLFGKDITFVRTPKYDAVGKAGAAKTSRYRVPLHPSVIAEILLAAWLGTVAVFAADKSWYVMSAFFTLFAVGFLWVGSATLLAPRARA